MKCLGRETNKKINRLGIDWQEQQSRGGGWEHAGHRWIQMRKNDWQAVSRKREGERQGCLAAEEGCERTKQSPDRQMEEGSDSGVGPRSRVEHFPILTLETTLSRATVYWELSVGRYAGTCVHIIHSDFCQLPQFLKQQVINNVFSVAHPLSAKTNRQTLFLYKVL